jgi:ribonuclease BN (tRNA processing enzyme)
MTIIPFGTNGFFPSFNRQTACFVIPHGKILIILDAGSGLFRFSEPIGKKLLEKAEEIHLYLSHYHLDHTFGFYAAFKLFKDKKVFVYARQEKQIFWEFVKLKHFPVDYQKVHQNFVWKILKTGNNPASNYSVQVRTQNHRGEESLAFRFKLNSEEFAYVTDSEYTREGISFVKNVPILLQEHDTLGKNAKELYNGNHVTTYGAARIAKEAKAGRLYLIHHNPFLNNAQLNQQLKTAKIVFAQMELSMDKKEII